MKSNQNPSECPHKIGLLHHVDYSELVTVNGLRKHIHDRNLLNDMIRSDPLFCHMKHMLRPRYSMKDYGDHRKNTNLTRFKYCPDCGTEIDWKALRQIES